MIFRNTNTGEYPVTMQEIIKANPNVSYPRNPTNIEGFDVVVEVVPPFFDLVTQYIKEGDPVNDNGTWRQTWTVHSYESEELAQRKAIDAANKSANIREERDTKLAQSDWTQVADAPVDKAAWATYRQALRDLTAQAGFPWTVTWPDAP